MARRVGELTAQYIDDVTGLERALAREGLTEAERGKRILEGFDKVRNAAQATRATTQTIGALGSAINEGAIEALNNSKDWARQQTMVANDEYQQTVRKAMREYDVLDCNLGIQSQSTRNRVPNQIASACGKQAKETNNELIVCAREFVKLRKKSG
jgi:hypothetical protein